MITFSLVTYKTSKEDFETVTQCVLNSELDLKLYISDNSPNDSIRSWCTNSRVEYIFNNANLGYGAGHNVAIRKALNENTDYHFVVNPDVSFEAGTNERIIDFMNQHKEIGLLMPRVLNVDGSLQYLCKYLPTPFNLFIRGFASQSKLAKKMNDNFEMHDTDYDRLLYVPYISGCYMVFRRDVLGKVLFDENIFMHMEDCEISRQVLDAGYKNVMWPGAVITHRWERATHKSIEMKNSTIKSARYYFNKYGWLFDAGRRKYNREAKIYNSNYQCSK